MSNIEDKHFKKQGWEINLISGGIKDIGPLLHICGNADQLLLPQGDDLKKMLKAFGLPEDFVERKKEQAVNYIAEGSSMTPNGYDERQQLLELMKDSLKLNINLQSDKAALFFAAEDQRSDQKPVKIQSQNEGHQGGFPETLPNTAIVKKKGDNQQ
jgi:hypothetical protein